MWKMIKAFNNNVRETERREINASNFNEAFVNVPSNLKKSLPRPPGDPLDYLTGSCGPGFAFSEVTFNQVRKVIDGMKNSVSKDPYDLDMRLLKAIKNLIIVPLTK